MRNYSKKKILILGMGITGISCLKFFISQKIYPKIMDFNNNLKNVKNVLKFKNIIYHIGSINYSWIQESDLIVTSPGIPLSHPALTYARRRSIEIIGDIELFVRETHIPIIAITGSNGKSTVTMMVNSILKLAGINTCVGGNIGIPVLDILNYSAEIYILELSSFQLETTFSLKSEISVILNVSANHINRYPLGIMEYAKNKLKIFEKAKLSVLNIDDKLSYNAYVKKKIILHSGLIKENIT